MVANVAERQETNSPTCYFCSRPVTDEAYCFGCAEYICDDCDTAPELCGDHSPDDHMGELRT